MIVTVTLNTAIDKTLSVPNFRLGRRHRTVEQTTMPGGKGVNVARVLKTLGAPVIATGLAGGATGTRIVDQLTQLSVLSGLRAHPRGVAHEHRGDRPDDRRADRDQRARPEGLRAGGRAVRRQAALPGQGREHVRVRGLAAARRRHRHLRAPDPRAAPPRRDDHRRHRRRPAAARRARRAGRRSRRTCSRPRSSSATSSTTTRTACIAVREMCELGAREAIMTMPDGCFAHMRPEEPGGDPRLYRVRVPAGAIEPRATVGSGDAFLAGFVAARYNGRPTAECLAYGVACGAESTQHLGAGLVDPGPRRAAARRDRGRTSGTTGRSDIRSRASLGAAPSAHDPRIPSWKLRSAEARRRAAPTDSMTSPSFPRAARATPMTSTSRGRSGPYRFELPLLASAMDGVVSPETAGHHRQARRPRGPEPRGHLDPLRGRRRDARADRRPRPRRGHARDAGDLPGAGQGRADRAADRRRSRRTASSPPPR